MKIRIVSTSTLPLPKYETTGSSGVDLHANNEEPITLKPGNIALIPTGLYMSIPYGYEGQIRGRSGLALNYGVTLANSVGTIDSDYRGEIKVILINHGEEAFIVNRGDRIAQFVLAKYEKIEFDLVDDLDSTQRNKGGFGHTGQ